MYPHITPVLISQRGNTPLHYAAQRGNINIVNLLVTKGASTTVKNNVSFNNVSFYNVIFIDESVCFNNMMKVLALIAVIFGRSASRRLYFSHWAMLLLANCSLLVLFLIT